MPGQHAGTCLDPRHDCETVTVNGAAHQPTGSICHEGDECCATFEMSAPVDSGLVMNDRR